MKDQIKQLETLGEKIAATWQMLNVDGMVAEMHGCEAEMQQADFWTDQNNAKAVSRRHEELSSEINTWKKIKQDTEELISLCQDLEKHPDPSSSPSGGTAPDESLVEEVKRDIEILEKKFQQLEFYVLLNAKNDKKNAIVAIHAGSGGTEAQDWASMLLRMVFRYAEKKGWQTGMIDESRGGEAGIKSATFRVEGRYAYGHLKSEHGTHRLVRISPFDSEKMRHTSFALIEVIPEMEQSEEVTINPQDLRIDTFMSGGKGGQSVNTTYSAVRIVHIPTGITVQCQNERSQLQNKETAMRILQSKLEKLQEEAEEKERLELRGEYKSAEWGNQIRSYVLHPYKMVKDVRTRYETTDPEAVLDGEINEFVEAYLKWVKNRVSQAAKL